MEFFANIDILINVLYYLDIKDICSLLKTSKSMRTTIIKHYQIYGINLNYMPIFIPCRDILSYLQHYHSYINGNNFPEEPLWLFRSKEDSKYINKNEKLNNIRFNRPTFLTINHEDLEFINGIEHWKQLNQEQRYIVWCQNSSLFQLQMTLSF